MWNNKSLPLSPFCLLLPFLLQTKRINALRAELTCSSPLFLFSLKYITCPPTLWLSPSDCLIQPVPPVTFYFFTPSPNAISKSKLVFLHRCCVVPGTSDKCCLVEVGLTGISLQESEMMGEAIKQLLISLSKWGGLCTVVESRSRGPQPNCLD